MITDCQNKAYTVIRQKLLSGEFSAGQRISDYKFAKEFNIGRGYVREAISQMASEGLLRQIPNRGAFVPEFSLAEIRDVFEVREELDGLAAFLATKKISLIQIDELKRYVELQGKISETLHNLGDDSQAISAMAGSIRDIDISFHMKILEFSGNRKLYEIGSHLYICNAIAGHSRVDLAQTGTTSTKLHQLILEAIEARDPELAKREASRHVREALNAIEVEIRQQVNESFHSVSVVKSIAELEKLSNRI